MATECECDTDSKRFSTTNSVQNTQVEKKKLDFRYKS